jgi:hypothetical protein
VNFPYQLNLLNYLKLICLLGLAEIIMIITYGANPRWMIPPEGIPPTKREHSHRMTQNIPDKQVLVKMCDYGKTKQYWHPQIFKPSYGPGGQKT